jgi:hypothetical protein
MDNPNAIAVSGIVVGQTITAYQFFLPPLREVRRGTDRGMVQDVYMGQLAAGAVSIGVGSMLAVLTDSRTPVYIAVFIALIIAGMYHYALVCRP